MSTRSVTAEEISPFINGGHLLGSGSSLEECHSLLEQTAHAAWDQPEALDSELPPVEKLTSAMIPSSLRPFVEDVAARMQVPLELPAVAAVATLAGMVNRRALIQPRRFDATWQVVPNLWGGFVADPGSMKSPVLAAMTASAKEMERSWQGDYEIAMASHQAECDTAEFALQAWKDGARKAQRDQSALPERPASAPEPPAQKRLLTSDATFESLHAILAKNPAGIFVLRDELSGWLAGLEQRGRERERAFYLEAWNGDSPYTLDTIGRGSVRVENVCVSLFGGIQPSRLRHYLADTLSGGPTNDGLIQRFQLLVWPDAVQEPWRYIDRAPDYVAQQDAARVYTELASIDPSQPVRARFDDEAQQVFIEWITGLEQKYRSHHTAEVMKAHLAKYRSLMPSLALLFGLADGERQVISVKQASLAACWCDLLQTHAERIYSAKATPEQAAAVSLSRRITDGMLGSGFSLRELYRKHWAGLTNPDEVRPVIRILEEAHWIRKLPTEKEKTGRPPSERYEINPRVEGNYAVR